MKLGNEGENVFSYEILSGIEPDQIIEYFCAIAETSKSEDGKDPAHVFIGRGWCVEVQRLTPRQHIQIRIPSTRLIFKGKKAVCEELILKYRKKFMRGGG